jgi:hypothetical protein
MTSLLQRPGMIGPLRMKNRLVMAPMGTNFSTSDGLSTERDRAYYEERAKGGVAAIVTEAMAVSEGGRAHNNSLWIYHDRFIPGLARLVESIKRHDCVTIGQINHRGALLRRMVLNMEPVGPSPWKNPNTGDDVRPLERAEITAIQKDFVTAARRLWQAGYDAVELHLSVPAVPDAAHQQAHRRVWWQPAEPRPPAAGNRAPPARRAARFPALGPHLLHRVLRGRLPDRGDGRGRAHAGSGGRDRARSVRRDE